MEEEGIDSMRSALSSDANSPKARRPGNGASCPQLVRVAVPFEPGRVRGAHFAAGDVGAPACVLGQSLMLADSVFDAPHDGRSACFARRSATTGPRAHSFVELERIVGPGRVSGAPSAVSVVA